MFKKLVIALMLLAAPFAQAKAVLVCAMMQGQIVEQCCRDDDDCRQACVMSQGAAREVCCCAVAIDTNGNIAFGAAAESVDKKPVKKLWDSSPDLATGPPPASMAAVSDASRASLPFEPHTHDGSRLYLLTARLRL